MSEQETTRATTTLVIQPGGGGTTSSSSSVQKSSSSSAMSVSKSSSSSSTMSQKTSSTKTSTTTMKSTSTKSSSTTMKSSSSSTIKYFSSSTSSSKNSVRIRDCRDSDFSSIFAEEFGISDVDSEFKKLSLKMNEEVDKARQEFFHLAPLERSGAANELIKIEANSIDKYLDRSDKDKMKLNFDVNEFVSESINVKAVGNKIEVHAQKKTKKGDDETNEEYSRSYELPTSGTLDPDSLTSSFYKDGILTVELPAATAIDIK